MQPAHAAANPAAGWFTDPHVPNALRWWDGFQWTHHVHPAAPVATPTPSAATNGFNATANTAAPAAAASPFSTHNAYAPQYATSSAAAVTQDAGPMLGASAEPSLMEANPKSMTAIGFSVVYLVIAITTGVVVAGIVPALYTFKAFGRGEKLAPVALLTAVVAIGFAFTHMQVR